jgi:acetyl esterase
MALAYPTLPGDIDHLIADDHAVVERQFQHLEAGRGNRRVLVDQISFELALHAFAEETVLYPMWDEHGMSEMKQDAKQEHQRLKELLLTLSHGEPGEDSFEQAVTELISCTRHHVDDEEEEELPEFRKKVGADKMAELGKQFLAAKRKAPTRPHPHAADEGTAEKVAGALAAPLDKARDRASGKKTEMATDPSGLLDPQMQEILDAFSSLGPQPFEILEVDQARKQPGPKQAVQKVMQQRGIEGPEKVGSVEDKTIPGPGGELKVRVYKPLDASPGPLPVLIWIHGGGWVLFDIDSHYDDSCRGLTNKTDCIVVSPEYRRAPEHVFPASHDDVLATYRWVVDNADTIGGDPERIAIGGESVGGNMAPATCLQLQEAAEKLPVFQVLVYPVTTGEQFGESMQDAADARPLNRPLLSWMAMHAFEGVPDAAKDPRIDLLGWSPDQLSGLPPALVITDERDPLRSQGQEFAKHLEAAGVTTTSSYYEGVSHEFFGAAAVLDKAQQAQLEVAMHLRRAFGTSGTEPYPTETSTGTTTSPLVR